MIIVDDVYKRYQTDHGVGDWVLRGASFTIPANTNVGLVGKNGAGKSTLLRIIGGVDQPTRGAVQRHCNVSWPMGFGGGLQKSLTGRQNSKFVCRIYGHEDDMPEKLSFIQAFAEIGDAFEEPIKTYSSGMQARLKFAMSLAFDFDVYISDELTAVGDVAFKQKARDAFRDLIGRAGLIMVSHSEQTLKDFCSAGIWINEGKTYWFDSIDEALVAYNKSESAIYRKQDKPVSKKRERAEVAIMTIERGLAGNPDLIDEQDLVYIRQQARRIGVSVMSIIKLTKQGYQLKDGATPVLIVKFSDDKSVDLYDLNSQCVKVDDK